MITVLQHIEEPSFLHQAGPTLLVVALYFPVGVLFSMLYWLLLQDIAQGQTPVWSKAFSVALSQWVRVLLGNVLLMLVAVLLSLLDLLLFGAVLIGFWELLRYLLGTSVHLVISPALQALLVGGGLFFAFAYVIMMPSAFYTQSILFEQTRLLAAVKRAYRFVFSLRNGARVFLFLFLPIALLLFLGGWMGIYREVPGGVAGAALLFWGVLKQAGRLLLVAAIDFYMGIMAYCLFHDLRARLP